jgi:D-glycero-D-manno-heptose 1,7-bisphosphate phosphatase
MKKNTAVFMDRDGTINEEVGYLSRIEELRLIPGAAQAIRLINDTGLKTVVITNQSGVARGFFTEECVRIINSSLNEMLRLEGAFIDRFYYCPHHPTAGNEPYRRVCDCRKPAPGMLLQAAEDLSIDLAASYVIGDMLKDLEAGRRVGAKGILVRTGYGNNIVVTDKPSYIARDLLDAVKWILSNRQKT